MLYQQMSTINYVQEHGGGCHIEIHIYGHNSDAIEYICTTTVNPAAEKQVHEWDIYL